MLRNKSQVGVVFQLLAEWKRIKKSYYKEACLLFLSLKHWQRIWGRAWKHKACNTWKWGELKTLTPVRGLPYLSPFHVLPYGLLRRPTHRVPLGITIKGQPNSLFRVQRDTRNLSSFLLNKQPPSILLFPGPSLSYHNLTWCPVYMLILFRRLRPRDL